MAPVERLEVIFQAYQFVLETVRLSEQSQYFDYRRKRFGGGLFRRMQGDQRLGKKKMPG
jgi:hypothetical protein